MLRKVSNPKEWKLASLLSVEDRVEACTGVDFRLLNKKPGDWRIEYTIYYEDPRDDCECDSLYDKGVLKLSESEVSLVELVREEFKRQVACL